MSKKLKTLKDIESYEIKGEAQIEGYEPTEFKAKLFSEHQLRQEAIKWRKRNTRDDGLLAEFIQDYEKKGFTFAMWTDTEVTMFLDWFIDKFFNITEEKLDVKKI